MEGSRSSFYRLLIAVSLAALFVPACDNGGGGSGGGNDTGLDDAGGSKAQIDIAVDESIESNHGTLAPIAGSNAERKAAVVVDGDGNRTEFVEREILVTAKDKKAAEKIADRMNAKILTRLTPKSVPEKADHIFILRLEQLKAKTGDIAGALHEKARGAEKAGSFSARFSSEAGLKTLAAATNENQANGSPVSPNWILESQAVTPTSDSTEAKKAESKEPSRQSNYSRNAFDWPYFTSEEGSHVEGPLGIGVDEAWPIVDALGRRAEDVPLMIFDGGFFKSKDVPGNAKIVPSSAWGRKNPSICSGGTKCPYHGTKVASVAAGVPDNDFGVTGPGAPVARPILVSMPSADLAQFIQFAFGTAREVIGNANPLGQGGIINISASVRVDSAFCLLGICKVADRIAKTARQLGYLVISSAGNMGNNVDNTTGLLDRETDKYIPCELTDVLCVGGLKWKSNERHPNSNFGTRGGVDIYGPYVVWASKVAGGKVQNVASMAQGTSYSSPFVAGVAALVWSVKPDMSPLDLRSWLLSEGLDEENPRAPRIDAYNAVLEAAKGRISPTVELIYPNSGDRFKRLADTIPFTAKAEDLDGAIPTIIWKSDKDGKIGEGNTVRRDDLSAGTHKITASVRDDDGHRDEESITIRVEKEPPVIQIVPPESGSSFPKGTIVDLSARTFNPKGDSAIPDNNIEWTIGGNTTVFKDGLGVHAILKTKNLALGRHEVKATAKVGGSVVGSDKIDIDITKAPSGNLGPRAILKKPRSKTGGKPRIPADKGDSKGSYAEVELCGYGDDPDGPKILGSEVTWFKKVKNSGKSFKAVTTNDSSKECTTYDFYLDNGSAVDYVVKMQVADKDGASDAAKQTFEVYPPGPI